MKYLSRKHSLAFASLVWSLAGPSFGQSVSIDRDVFTPKDEVSLHWSAPDEDDEHDWQLCVVRLTPREFETGGVDEVTWTDVWKTFDDDDDPRVGQEEGPYQSLNRGQARQHLMAAIVDRRADYAIHDRVLYTVVHGSILPRPLEISDESTFVEDGTVVIETALEEGERVALYRVPVELYTGEVVAGKYIKTANARDVRGDDRARVRLRGYSSSDPVRAGHYELHLMVEHHPDGEVILGTAPITIDEAPIEILPFERAAAAQARGLLDFEKDGIPAGVMVTYPDLSNLVSDSDNDWKAYWKQPEPFGTHLGAIVSSTSSGYESLVFGFEGIPDGWVDVDLNAPHPDPDTWEFTTWLKNTKRWSLELLREGGEEPLESWQLEPGELVQRRLPLPIGPYLLRVVETQQLGVPLGTNVERKVLARARFEVGCPPQGASLNLQPYAPYEAGQRVSPSLTLSEEIGSEDFTGELELWLVVEERGAPCPPCYRNDKDIDEKVEFWARHPDLSEPIEGGRVEFRMPTRPGEYVARLYAPVPKMQSTVWGSYLRLIDEIPFDVRVPSSRLALISPSELAVREQVQAQIDDRAPHDSEMSYLVVLELDGYAVPGGAKVLPYPAGRAVSAEPGAPFDCGYGGVAGDYHLNLYYGWVDLILLDSVPIKIVDPKSPGFPSLTATTPDDVAPRYSGPTVRLDAAEPCPPCPGFDATAIREIPEKDRGVELTILAPSLNFDYPIDTIEGVRPFRVQLSYAEPPSRPPGFATVRWKGDAAPVVIENHKEPFVFTAMWSDPWIAVELEATDDPRVFRSGWLSLAVPAAPTPAPPSSLGMLDPKSSARNAAALFPGRWDVAHTGGELDGATGMAVVGATGEHAVLWLGSGDERRRYDSLEMLATRDAAGRRHTLDIRFRDITRPPATRPPAPGEDYPESTVLYVPKLSEALDIFAVGKLLRVPVALPEPLEPPESRFIRVQLMSRGDGARMAGAWNGERADGALLDGGQQTWSRGLRIDEVFTLEDQRPMPPPRTPPTIADFAAATDPSVAGLLPTRPKLDRSTTYPFGENVHHTAKRHRRLFVYGENLPQVAADAIALESGDPLITYTLDSLPGEGEIDLFDRGWAKARERARDKGLDPTKLHAIVLRAELAEGVTAGAKAFALNGAIGFWHLDFADATALLSFAHRWHDDEDTGEGVFHFTESLYVGDIAYVVLDEAVAIPHEGIPLELSLNGKPVASLYAKRGGKSPDDAEYRTGPLRLRRKGAPDETPAGVGGPLVLEVEKGDELSVTIQDPTLLRTFPATAVAKLENEPNDLGATWKDALERTAACYGEGEVDFDSMTREKADEYSRFILTENLIVLLSPPVFAFLEDRKIEISKGDHAAAILIRDEFVKMMEVEIPRMRADMVDEEKAWKLFLDARTSGLPFWSLSDVPGPDGEIWTLKDLAKVVSPGLAWTDMTEGWEQITLHDPNKENLRELVLRMVDFPEQWGLTPQQAHLTAFEITRTAYFRMLDLADGAVQRAKAAGDCDCMELMLIAGQDADQVVARILPRLVRRVEKNGREAWEPDLVAQNFVKSLKVKGQALRALEEYGRVDDTYKALALAAATAGAGFAISTTGAVMTAASVVLAGDMIDMVAFGGTDMYRALESEELLLYAEGAALVLGEKFYAEAEAARTEWWEAAVGVLLPGAGGTFGFRQLRSLRRANKGARVMLGLKDLGPKSLARLRDADLADLTAYFTHLHERRPGKFWKNLKNRGETLGPRELADLARFDEFFKNANLPPAPGSVPIGRLIPDLDGKTTQVGPEHQIANVQGDVQLAETATTAIPSEAYRNLPQGGVRINGDGPTLNLGEWIGEGKTTTAIDVQGQPDQVYRVLRRGYSPTEFRIDEAGNEMLTRVEAESNGLFEVPKVEGAWHVESVSDPRYGALVGSHISLVRKSEGEALDLINARGGITFGQVFAYDQVVRYLNRRGIAWTDAHFGNFELKLVDEERDLWTLVIFDTGGFYPANGATELERYLNARAIQESFSAMTEQWRRDWIAAHALEEGTARIDRIDELEGVRAGRSFFKSAKWVDFDDMFGEIAPGFSGCPTALLHRPVCRRLTDLSPGLADALAAAHTKVPPPRPAPRGSNTAPARTFTPEELDAARIRLLEPYDPPGSVGPHVDPKGSTIDVPPDDDGGQVFLWLDGAREPEYDELRRAA